jgi:hypothetical protein
MWDISIHQFRSSVIRKVGSKELARITYNLLPSQFDKKNPCHLEAFLRGVEREDEVDDVTDVMKR